MFEDYQNMGNQGHTIYKNGVDVYYTHVSEDFTWCHLASGVDMNCAGK